MAKFGKISDYLLKQDVVEVIRSAPVVAAAATLPPRSDPSCLPGEVLSEKANIVFVHSALEFWVAVDPAEVDELMAEVDAWVSSTEFQDVAVLQHVCVGQACLTLFHEDSRWYRAVVLDIDVDKVTVNYVDYGNSCTVSASGLKPLPCTLAVKPALALKCSLDVEGIVSEELNVKFLNLFDQLGPVKVNFLKLRNDTVCVDVFDVASSQNLKDVLGLHENVVDEQVPQVDTPLQQVSIEGSFN